MAVPKKKRSRKYYHFKLDINVSKAAVFNPVILENKKLLSKKLPALKDLKNEVALAPILV